MLRKQLVTASRCVNSAGLKGRGENAGRECEQLLISICSSELTQTKRTPPRSCITSNTTAHVCPQGSPAELLTSRRRPDGALVRVHVPASVSPLGWPGSPRPPAGFLGPNWPTGTETRSSVPGTNSFLFPGAPAGPGGRESGAGSANQPPAAGEARPPAREDLSEPGGGHLQVNKQEEEPLLSSDPPLV